METLLKHSLLLTHGTVYGQIDPLGWFDLRPKSTNIDQWDDPGYDWRDGLFGIISMAAPASGAMVDNAPVDLVSWSVAGSLDVSPMLQWRGCLKLLRHI